MVIIPRENERDLIEIPRNIKQNLDIRPVRWIDEVLDLALAARPEPVASLPEAEVPVEAGDKAGERPGARLHH